mgnify:FL=1
MQLNNFESKDEEVQTSEDMQTGQANKTDVQASEYEDNE